MVIISVLLPLAQKGSSCLAFLNYSEVSGWPGLEWYVLELLPQKKEMF